MILNYALGVMKPFLHTGVGGIEAEAVMLGQPISMVLPQVIGYRLVGSPHSLVTSTDIVLTITKVTKRCLFWGLRESQWQTGRKSLMDSLGFQVLGMLGNSTLMTLKETRQGENSAVKFQIIRFTLLFCCCMDLFLWGKKKTCFWNCEIV